MRRLEMPVADVSAPTMKPPGVWAVGASILSRRNFLRSARPRTSGGPSRMPGRSPNEDVLSLRFHRRISLCRRGMAPYSANPIAVMPTFISARARREHRLRPHWSSKGRWWGHPPAHGIGFAQMRPPWPCCARVKRRAVARSCDVGGRAFFYFSTSLAETRITTRVQAQNACR